MKRYELRHGKFGPYFHDTQGGGLDLSLERVLGRLNEIDELKARLKKANKGRTVNTY
jgi:hypothetical protein